MIDDFLTEAFLALKGRWKSEDVLLQDAFCRLWGRKYKIGSVKEAIVLLSRTGRNIEIDEHRKASGRQTDSKRPWNAPGRGPDAHLRGKKNFKGQIQR